MRHFRSVLVALLLMAGTAAWGRSVSQTIYSDSGDRVTLAYDVSRDADLVTVSFWSVKVELCKENKRKYRDADKLSVLFFDRTGNYEKMSFVGLFPKAFMVSSNLSYSPSGDGYFIVDSGLTLFFSVRDGGDFKLVIPFYLAFAQKRTSYKLFSSFTLAMAAEAPLSVNDAATAQSVSKEAPRAMNMVSAASPEDYSMVLDCVSNVERMLARQTSLPVSEGLKAEVELLRSWKYSVTDRSVKRRIEKTLDDYDMMVKELQDAESAAKQAEIDRLKEEERQARLEEQKKEDARIAAEKEEAEKSRRRTIWMIIAGILLAVLSFVGNQVMQSLRASRGQKSMMEMQQNLTKRAENEAKRRAQSAIRSNTRKVVNLAGQKAKEAMKKTANGINKKNITI